MTSRFAVGRLLVSLAFIALLALTIFGTYAYQSDSHNTAPPATMASALSTCEIQILDGSGNELTDPNNRPVFSTGYASVDVPSSSLYRIKFVNCGSLPCGTGTRLYVFAVNDVNFTNNYGVASGASGAYLYTLYPNDPLATVTLNLWGFRQ